MSDRLRLPAIPLPGLTPDSLGNYLASLGLLRVLSRKWPSTRIAWRDEVLQVVGGPTTLDELLDELVRVADSQADSDRRTREWTQYDKAWSDAQKKGTKAKSGGPLALWQAEAEESTLELFSAHAVPHARVSFNPLLGSGGNAGRRDFSAGWMQAVNALATIPAQKRGRGKKIAATAIDGDVVFDSRRSELRALLLGEPLNWVLEKLAAGSWFSDATKVYNSGQSPAREGQISPWAMALACEGLVFLAGGASRRLGARSARAVGAFPFVTLPIAATAEKEADRLRGEIWTPMWSRPMTLAEVSTLFARGRAELHGRGVTTPAAFATAIRRRGVDAGISEFRRFTLGRTTSANTFEPRLEARFVLDDRSKSGDAALSLTLERVTALIEQRGFPRDGKRFMGLRGPIETAILDVAAATGRSELVIALLDAITAALDRIDRNRSFRESNVRWEPLPISVLSSLFADEQPGLEARLALALVSGFPAALPFAAYRFGVEWSGGGRYDWTTSPHWFQHSKVAPARWVWGPGELARILGTVLWRRLFEEGKLDAISRRPRRKRTLFTATLADLHSWFAGELDERLLATWLSRLAIFDWRQAPQELTALIQGSLRHARVDGATALVGLLQPLVDQRPLIVRSLSPKDLLSDETGARTTAAARSLVALVRSGNLDGAVRVAHGRYAMADARLASFDVPWHSLNPDRLAAALLFTISDRDRAVLFERWLRPRRRQQGSETYV